MGTWGHNSFENDGALDWWLDLRDASNRSVIVTALEAVTLGNKDYIDIEAGTNAVAAAEIVAALNGNAATSLPEGVRPWLVGQSKPDSRLIARAQEAIEAVLGNSNMESELNELWKENEEDWPKWAAALEDLKSRLTHPSRRFPTKKKKQRGTKLPYKEGDWFAVPLRCSGYAIGLVARVNKKGMADLGYFFGPRRDSIPSLDDIASLDASLALRVLKFGDLHLIDGTWPIIGSSSPWKRQDWPIPAFAHWKRQTGKALRLEFDDDDPEHIVSTKTISLADDSLEYYQVSGAGAVEIHLTVALEDRSYSEGDWFAVPLGCGGYAAGLVARSSRRSRVLLGYFFGPRRKAVPSLDEMASLTARQAIRVVRFIDTPLKEAQWPIIGPSRDWNRLAWPIPAFVTRIPTTNKAFKIIYSDNDLTRVICEERIDFDDHSLEPVSVLRAQPLEDDFSERLC